jgi:hypothetical protein
LPFDPSRRHHFQLGDRRVALSPSALRRATGRFWRKAVVRCAEANDVTVTAGRALGLPVTGSKIEQGWLTEMTLLSRQFSGHQRTSEQPVRLLQRWTSDIEGYLYKYSSIT